MCETFTLEVLEYFNMVSQIRLLTVLNIQLVTEIHGVTLELFNLSQKSLAAHIHYIFTEIGARSKRLKSHISHRNFSITALLFFV